MISLKRLINQKNKGYKYYKRIYYALDLWKKNNLQRYMVEKWKKLIYHQKEMILKSVQLFTNKYKHFNDLAESCITNARDLWGAYAYVMWLLREEYW